MDDDKKYNINDELKKSISGELDAYMSKESGDAIIPEGTAPAAQKSLPNQHTISDTLRNIEDKASEAEHKPIVRTYKGDMEETIQRGHLSSINIAVSQSNKMLKESHLADVEVKKAKINKKIIIVSLVLIVGGALAAFIPYLLVQKQAAPTTAQTITFSPTSILTPDIEEKINIQDINLNNLGLILNQRIEQSSTALGQIKDFVLTTGTSTTERLLTSTEFLSLLGLHVPDQISRTLEPAYMFGMHNFDGNQKFLILKVGAYDTTFAGMLSWEELMYQDFTDVFGLQNLSAANNTPATDSTSLPGIDIEKFQDATFSNKDCRVVKDAAGNIVFMYSIIDDNTVVITTDPNTLKEILLRTNKARVSTQ